MVLASHSSVESLGRRLGDCSSAFLLYNVFSGVTAALVCDGPRSSPDCDGEVYGTAAEPRPRIFGRGGLGINWSVPIYWHGATEAGKAS